MLSIFAEIERCGRPSYSIPVPLSPSQPTPLALESSRPASPAICMPLDHAFPSRSRAVTSSSSFQLTRAAFFRVGRVAEVDRLFPCQVHTTASTTSSFSSHFTALSHRRSAHPAGVKCHLRLASGGCSPGSPVVPAAAASTPQRRARRGRWVTASFHSVVQWI